MQTKDLLDELFHTAVEAVKPHNLIRQHCRLDGSILNIHGDSYDLSSYGRVFVFGSGKASLSMAEALEELLGDYIHSGLVVAPVCDRALKKTACMVADHPIPSERSLRGAKALIEKMSECHRDDLYIYLLSGGSSALIELPVEGITLDELQMMTELMLKNGLKISEINAVRKHLSSIKGGRLGEFSPAKGVVLTISDVIGDDLYSIGSAPLYADTSTYEQVKDILNTYEIMEEIPSSVRKVIEEGVEHIRVETPKTPSAYVKHYLIGTNALARQAVYEKATALGLDAKVIDEDIDMNVTEAVEKMRELAFSHKEKIIIFGGETTVKVHGKGNGGRNQHSVLSMLKAVEKKGLQIAFLSAGTDGIDGNSDAAGAYIDTASLERAYQEGLDIDAYLGENDSYHFFKQLDSLIMTGPTGTNVMDIAILIKE